MYINALILIIGSQCGLSHLNISILPTYHIGTEYQFFFISDMTVKLRTFLE